MTKKLCYFVLFLCCNLVCSQYQCQMDKGTLNCRNLTSVEDLEAAMREFWPPENINSISMIDSDLPYMPIDIFDHSRISSISMINSTVHSLSNSDLAFQGLENYLLSLFMNNVQNMSEWDWLKLRDQQRMYYLTIYDSEFQISQELPSLKSLKTLLIMGCKISYIHPTAFSKFENLTLVMLGGNNLTELSRSMFPRPAVNITTMHLEANLLTHLPSDMFEDMPLLYSVALQSNHLKTLDEKTFSWVFNHAECLFFDDNYINCDCHLEWLKTVKMSGNESGCNTGLCYLPSYLNGVSLWNLTDVPLYC